jgi:hypothetical protein
MTKEPRRSHQPAIPLFTSPQIAYLLIDPPTYAAHFELQNRRIGAQPMADFVIGALFVALTVTPAALGAILRRRAHRAQF